MATTERCDVCIVGAGIAGLNALFVASRYLTSDQKIVLVDRRERVGGMWVDTYSYVRLHQPHPMFTAGNIAWMLGERPAYLATKGEVHQRMLSIARFAATHHREREHWRRTLDTVAQRFDVRCGPLSR